MERLCVMLTIVLLLFCVQGAGADEGSLDVGNGLTLLFNLPGEHWQLTTRSPQYLVEDAAHHLEHELAEKGRDESLESRLKMARKRLAENEGYICNQISKACMMIDFSPLREDETAPAEKSIRLSARYAGESLAGEEGMTNVRTKSFKTELEGAEFTYRIDSDYTRHGEPGRFLGLVGFVPPSWFFLYYHDPLKVDSDYGEMERIIGTLKVTR